jgi:hypothetical protein
MLGTESPAQWYKVPPSGQVTFALTEEWAVFKGPPAASTVMGDATVAIAYLNGATFKKFRFKVAARPFIKRWNIPLIYSVKGHSLGTRLDLSRLVQSSAYFPRLSLKHTTRLNFLREASLALMYLAA